MTKEVKIAIAVLVCIVGLIAFVEFSKKSELPPVEPIPEVAVVPQPQPVVEQPIAVAPPVIEPVKPVVVEAAPLPVEIVAPKEEVKVDPPKPVVKPKPKSDVVAPNAKIASRYVVQKGDTLRSICEKELGSVKFQSALMDSNPELQAHRLYPGIELVLPSKATLVTVAERENSLNNQSKDVYIVKKGDSLFGISKKVLGSGNRVNEIIKLNPNVDPSKLHVGTRLKMPKA